MERIDTGLIYAAKAEVPEGEPATRAQTLIRWLFWGGLFTLSLLLFTLLKLPEEPIRALLLGQANQALGSLNLRIDSDKSRLSFWLGPRYTLENVTLASLDSNPLPAGESPTKKIGEISLAPRFLPLFLGRQAATTHITQGIGKIDLAFSQGGDFLSVAFNASQVDLDKAPYLDLFAGFHATGTLFANGSIEGKSTQPESFEGKIALNLSKFMLPAQSIRGFRLPPLQLTEGKLRGEMVGGKFTIQEMTVGRPGGADDVYLTGTGELSAGRTLYGSKLALKLRLTLSRKLLDAFPLIDGILGVARKGEGQYAFELVGPLTSPSMNPIP